ncbi:TIGR02680 family protein [Yinghuangia seranimata]|uniref:TIGR02680 family protein n=1 Tax=Yinghuangia seranimata TaxID=408067 RepID=UPI00248BEDFC|nr:TIGR02680 family protein [Yinghuangia seranimata]MDI2125101.1 TIGR02680 family protein [Yinghuangia seranimata]
MTTASMLPNPVPPLPRHPHRYRINRAGIRNVWQYDDAEFHFGDGRLLLRGKNGAGKSKALEMLLPFLLDGESRLIDSTGSGRTTLKWLMLDGYERTNRLGYLWIEFLRTDADNERRRVTLGAAVRASTSTQEAKPLFFITPLGVGDELALVADGQPLPIDALKEAVGSGNWFDRAVDYRARVARELFGITDAARYRSLTHLLHRLRRPTVGDRIEEGGLTSVLSEALPPLDDDILDRVAQNLDDLDTIRTALHDVEVVERAVEQFLSGYQAYLHGVLRGRAGQVRERLEGLGTARRVAGEAERTVAGLVLEETDAGKAVTALEDEERAAEAELQGVRDSDLYRGVVHLQDRRRAVQAVEQTAGAEERTAQSARESETAAAQRLATEVARIRTETTGHARDLKELARLAAESGVDAAHLGSAPSPRLESVAPRVVETVTGSEVVRPAVATVATAHLVTELREWADQLHVSVPVVKARLRAADTLDGALAEAARLSGVATESEAEVVRLDAAYESATARVEEAQAHVIAAGDAYADQTRRWAEGLGSAARAIRELVGAPGDAALPFEERALSADTPDAVAATAHEIAEPLLAQLREQRDSALAELRGCREHGKKLAAERARWEALADLEPEPFRYRRAPRTAGTGAPFYRLVAFRAGLGAAEQAGIEAALEASGLLDAWVAAEAEGSDLAVRDIVLSAGEPIEGPSLAAVLEPVRVPGSGIANGHVAELLASIGLYGGVSRISPDGSWRLGAAHGAHHKTHPEFVGAEMRAETRRRRIAELDAEICEAGERTEAARQVFDDVEARLEGLRGLLRVIPVGRELAAAWVLHERACRDTDELRGRLGPARRAAEGARAEAVKARREADAYATSHALPADRVALARTRSMAERLAQELPRLRRAVTATEGAMATHDDSRQAWERSREKRVEAEDRHGTAVAELEAAHAQLLALEEALGEDPQAVLRRERAVAARLEGVRGRLPKARGRAIEMRDRRVRAASERDARRVDLGVSEDAVVGAGGNLRRVLALPEVLRGAGLDAEATLLTAPEPPGSGVRERIRSLGELLDGLEAMLGPRTRDLTETQIHNRFNDLRDGIRGGYDAALEEQSGVWLCHVTDDQGRHDVALVARRLARQAEDARTRVSTREREVFERYLLGELGDNLTHQVFAARQLIKLMNDTLDDVRTSHGLGARLVWELRDKADADVVAAHALLTRSAAMRSREETAQLREALQRRIESVRADDPTAGYAQHLRRALDYRDWFIFKVHVVDAAHPGSHRVLTSRIGLSQGEQRVISYLVLFATAAAHFSSVAGSGLPVPRMILLDDAFAKVDEPTHGRLLDLLVQLDLDFVLTSERLWGTFRQVPALHIYECLRDPHQRGVALQHFVWEGARQRLVVAG